MIVTRYLRPMAWERAKGELRSMLHTFNSSEDDSDSGRFEKFDKLLNDFIKEVEDWGLQE